MVSRPEHHPRVAEPAGRPLGGRGIVRSGHALPQGDVVGSRHVAEIGGAVGVEGTGTPIPGAGGPLVDGLLQRTTPRQRDAVLAFFLGDLAIGLHIGFDDEAAGALVRVPDWVAMRDPGGHGGGAGAGGGRTQSA